VHLHVSLLHNQPYGVTAVGATVLAAVTDEHGGVRLVRAAQGAQSAYGVLQLPFAVLGLARTTSYVDTVVLGVLRSQVRRRTHSRIEPGPTLI